MNRMNESAVDAAIDGSGPERGGAAPSGPEQVLATLDRALSGAPPPLPASLRAQLIENGEAQLRARQAVTPGPARWWRRTIPIPVPLALAAVLVALVGLALVRPGIDGDGPTDVSAFERSLLAEGGTRAAWEPLGDARYAAVSGSIVWSDAAQAGVLRVSGIPASVPGESSYQLWIVDPERDDEPVDGGVFDVAGPETAVPVRARLPVSEPRAFAVTLEKAGGVVVSDGPLLFVATRE